ncbi:MAG: hypothetical protein LM577_08810 [Thermoproteaceae archaeon]|nr:hypothetical protein [Thermoproteaceae archaeon]
MSNTFGPIQIGEAKARLVAVVGFYEEVYGLYAKYGDIARATGRSLNRARTMAHEARREGLVEIFECGDRTAASKARKTGFSEAEKMGLVCVRLTERGWHVYTALKAVVAQKLGREPADVFEFVKALDEILYASYSGMAIVSIPVGPGVEIKVGAFAAKMRELTGTLRERLGVRAPAVITGVASELVGAAEQAASLAAELNLENFVTFGKLSETILNVPLRVVRLLEVSLPPNIARQPLPLSRIEEELRRVALWPARASRKVYDYAVEADHYGLVSVIGRGSDAIVSPRLPSGLSVVDKVTGIGFDVIAAAPTRFSIPVLAIYGDAVRHFPTVEELLECRTEMLSAIADVVGPSRCIRWVEHALGVRKHLETPALALEAQYETLGMMSKVKVKDEERVLALTVARRIVGRNLERVEREGGGLKNMLDAARKEIKGVLERSGPLRELLLETIKRGWISWSEAEQILKRMGVDESKVTRYLSELRGLSFLYETAAGYISAWTLMPIFGEIDDKMRQVLAWLHANVLNREDPYAPRVSDAIRALVETGRASLEGLVGSVKDALALGRRFELLARLGAVELDESSLEVRIAEPRERNRRLLEAAYIGFMTGMEPPDVKPEGREPELREYVASRARELARG